MVFRVNMGLPWAREMGLLVEFEMIRAVKTLSTISTLVRPNPKMYELVPLTGSRYAEFTVAKIAFGSGFIFDRLRSFSRHLEGP